MGSLPPEESITISDQIMPVVIFTEATWEMEMLSSVLPNKRDFTRLTRRRLTMIFVGKIRLPLVQRLALKVSDWGSRDISCSQPSAVSTQSWDFSMPLSADSYTHSNAPFFQIQIYPTSRMPRKTSISIKPNTPRYLNFTAQGKRKMVSTSKTTNNMPMRS